MTITPHQQSKASTPSPSDRIEADKKVVELLNDITRQHLRLQCTSHDRRGEVLSFDTRLIKIDERQQTITLVRPPTVDQVQPGNTLRLTCQHLGALMQFDVEFILTDNVDSTNQMTLEMPTKLAWTHKRGSIRRTVNRENSCSLQFSVPNGATLDIPLDNISTTGCGLLSQSLSVDDFHVDQVLTDATLHLEDTPIRCDAEVRFVRQEMSKGPVRVGTKFKNLRPSDESLIARWIARQMRLEQKRKRYMD